MEYPSNIPTFETQTRQAPSRLPAHRPGGLDRKPALASLAPIAVEMIDVVILLSAES